MDPLKLPCLSKKFLTRINYLINKEYLTDFDLNYFFDTFGTHITLSGIWGGEIVLQSKFDWSTLFACGVSGNIVLDPVNGWCNYLDRTAKCDFISNGNLTGNAQCNSNT